MILVDALNSADQILLDNETACPDNASLSLNLHVEENEDKAKVTSLIPGYQLQLQPGNHEVSLPNGCNVSVAAASESG